jgi:hypothetical protein
MAEQNENGARRVPLPPRPTDLPLPADPAARRLALQERDAQVRGVTSIAAMRDAVKAMASALPPMTAVARVGQLDATQFRVMAGQGMPFIMTGIVKRWPLAALTLQDLRARHSALPVRARVGDYVNTAFAPDRAMQDMSLGQYLDIVTGDGELPPYVGNLEMRELNRLCHWPGFFDKMGPPRFWIGPARTVTPLHCDFDDNIFAQIWGTKRIFLAPPHHDAFLYTREANPVLFGSPVDPEAPDFARFPLARQVALVECMVAPGDMLYVPAGWYHQVRAQTFSLSANRWARAVPLALGNATAIRRPTP